MKTSHLYLVATFAVAVISAGCNEHAPLRENANAQNAALLQERKAEIEPADGKYTGMIDLNYRNLADNSPINGAYEAELEIQTVVETKASTDASQPTETVNLPRLWAHLSFKVLNGLDEAHLFLPQYLPLLTPMGMQQRINFDMGDYTRATKFINLPYSVVSYTQGTFGSFSGTLNGNTFNGTWSAKSLGTAGTFSLVKH